MSKTTSNNRFDDELVGFLKTYCPETPPETKPCEELVMRAISQGSAMESAPCHCVITPGSNHWRKTFPKIGVGWLLPGTLITTLLIIGSYFFNMNSKPVPQIASETEDLEPFLVNSWYGSMAQESEFNLVTVNDEF